MNTAQTKFVAARTITRVAALAASVASLFFLAGCGGGDNNDSDLLGTGGGTVQPAVSRYAGTYKSTVALPNGATGTTNITVAANGTATGTLTVAGGTAGRQATSFSFGTGVYAISGTVDPTTGAFSMTGNIGGQSFSYGGTLPTPGNGNVGGSYSLTAGGQTYTGSFANGGTVNPTPTPKPSPTPGVGNGESQSLTFSNIVNIDLDLSPFTNNKAYIEIDSDGVKSSTSLNANKMQIITTTAVSKLDNGAKRGYRKIDVSLGKSGTVATGDTFDLSQSQGSVNFFLFNAQDPTGRVNYYLANGSGTITVVSRTDKSITVRLTDVLMGDDGFAIKDKSVVLNGEITANIE